MLAAHELELLGQSVARIALSAQTAKLLAEIERLATSDPLTGLANRRLFDDTLERELARCRRSGAQLALAMLDVDHFKLVNDRYGHQIGDEVLRQLAMGLPAAARRESLVARYGGEEFVVLLPDASSEDAVIAAERLRRAAADVVAVSVTVSVGVASLADLGPDGDLVAAADTALYQAKAEGRDRTVCFRPEPAGGLDVSITVPGS
jgi:diguanylate cyclase (GGDEF)-like protein